MSQTPSSQTVEKTLSLLDFFTTGPSVKTASDIAKEAQFPLSTAFRLLATLVRLRFLDFDEVTKQYRLGLKLLELGHVVSQQLDLPRIAYPILQQLARDSGETAHLSIRSADEGVFVAKAEGEQSVRMHTPLGRRVPLHAGASMKVLLAHLTDEEIRAYLDRAELAPVTGRTILDAARLWEDLMQIRAQGYAVSFGEQTPGAAGVGAPVFDHAGAVAAGVTISGPDQRFASQNLERFIPLVCEAASALSARLGYRGRHPVQGGRL